MVIQKFFMEMIEALIVLTILSFLYKGENKFYRIAENLMIGITIAFTFYTGGSSIYNSLISPLIYEGKLVGIISLILSLLLFFRFIPSVTHLTRIPISFLLGVGSGVALVGIPKSQILIHLSVNNLLGPTPLDAINNIIYAVALFSAIAYFIFTKEHTGILGGVAKLGRIFIMVNFGAVLGALTSARIGRASYMAIALLVTKGGRIITTIVIIISVIYLIWWYQKR